MDEFRSHLNSAGEAVRPSQSLFNNLLPGFPYPHLSGNLTFNYVQQTDTYRNDTEQNSPFLEWSE